TITPENLPRHELIGLKAEVVECSDDNKEGISGEVMDETRDTLTIGGKTVEKENCVFLFELPSGKKVEMDGKLIAKRPEDRIDMKLPGKWEYVD
ncbi:MAG: ribonuclease P protein component 1, partial [Candidatus Nanohaloarchaea archaeon]